MRYGCPGPRPTAATPVPALQNARETPNSALRHVRDKLTWYAIYMHMHMSYMSCRAYICIYLPQITGRNRPGLKTPKRLRRGVTPTARGYTYGAGFRLSLRAQGVNRREKANRSTEPPFRDVRAPFRDDAARHHLLFFLTGQPPTTFS